MYANHCRAKIASWNSSALEIRHLMADIKAIPAVIAELGRDMIDESRRKIGMSGRDKGEKELGIMLLKCAELLAQEVNRIESIEMTKKELDEGIESWRKRIAKAFVP
jgi:hypothetical protein